jgi:hypothetical protein
MSDMPTPLPIHIERPLLRRAFGVASPSGLTARIALTIAAAVSCLIFAIACRIFRIPSLPGYDGIFFLQPSPIADILIVGVLVIVATLVCTVLAGAVHFEGGFFAAAFGLIAITLRCGTIQSVLFEANGSQTVFVRLTIELLLLGAILAIAWLMLRQIARALRGYDAVTPISDSGLLNNLTATAAQVVITGVILMVLCQSEAKNQCLASVGIASTIGTILAYKYASTHVSFWYWIGPLIVGIIGYALAAAGQDGTLAIGYPTGMFAPLSRPLPLDFASVGVAGAILGFWASQKPSTAE